MPDLPQSAFGGQIEMPPPTFAPISAPILPPAEQAKIDIAYISKIRDGGHITEEDILEEKERIERVGEIMRKSK